MRWGEVFNRRELRRELKGEFVFAAVDRSLRQGRSTNALAERGRGRASARRGLHRRLRTARAAGPNPARDVRVRFDHIRRTATLPLRDHITVQVPESQLRAFDLQIENTKPQRGTPKVHVRNSKLRIWIARGCN